MKNRCHRLCAFVPILLAAMGSVCAAGTIVTGSSYAEYDAAFADVAELEAVGRIGFSSGYASGTYLGDGWVLTAAHVADSASTFYFTVGGVLYTSSSVYIHDDWTGDLKSGGDVALIRLSDRNLERAQVQLYAGTTSSLLGQTVLITGYGLTGDGDTGATGGGGTLHEGQNVVERQGGSLPMFSSYDSSFLLLDFDDPLAHNDGYPWSGNNALEWEYMIAPGDSGGGAFVEIDGTYHLMGVNSFTLATDGESDSDYGDLGGVTCIAPYYDWILDTIATALIPGDANGDGKVDGSDLALWQQNYDPLGSDNNTPAMGDFNDDGTIDGTDLALWQQEYDPLGDASGGLASNLTTVGEPSTLLLGGAGLLSAARRRRRS